LGWGRNTVSCYAQAPETDVKFTGQLFDAETGLAYFNARYLRASMGSYISADGPLTDQGADDPQSWKLDSYVRNNPLAFVDPSGMGSIPDCSTSTAQTCVSVTDTIGSIDPVNIPPGVCYSLYTDSSYSGQVCGSSGDSTSSTTTAPPSPPIGQSPTSQYSGCPAVPVQPHNANILANIREAQSWRMLQLVKYPWFNSQVHNGGPWDYKQVRVLNDFGKKYPSLFQDFGNFHYGVVGAAAGIPTQILLRAAGHAQQEAKTSNPAFGNWYGGPPYGDDPADQAQILAGVKYYQNGCYK
jgi:RHS repeat-associated protein